MGGAIQVTNQCFCDPNEESITRAEYFEGTEMAYLDGGGRDLSMSNEISLPDLESIAESNPMKIRCSTCDQPRPPPNPTDWEKQFIGLSIHPDQIRAWFWGMFTFMLFVGAMITSYSDSVDWDDNPIINAYGVNNPCLYLDYMPSKQIVSVMFVVCLVFYTTYTFIRWGQALLAKNANKITQCEYRIYSILLTLQVFIMWFLVNVFSVGPDEDIQWHTIPFTSVTVAVVLDIATNLWWAWKVCLMEKYLIYSGFGYLVLITILSAIKIHKEMACVFNLSWGCMINSNGEIPLDVQITWVFLVLPMEMVFSLVKKNRSPNLHMVIRIPWDTTREVEKRQNLSWMEVLEENPLFFWPPFILLLSMMLLKIDRPKCFEVTVKEPYQVAIRFGYILTHLMLNFLGAMIYRKSAFCCARCCCTRTGYSNAASPYELHSNNTKDDKLEILKNSKYSEREATIYSLELEELEEEERHVVEQYENYIWKPLFLMTFIGHAFSANSRLNKDWNEWGTPVSMILCTLAQFWTAVYMIWWVKFCREKRDYSWHHPKVSIVVLMLLQIPFCCVTRVLIWIFGHNFSEILFGRTCGYKWTNL